MHPEIDRLKESALDGWLTAHSEPGEMGRVWGDFLGLELSGMMADALFGALDNAVTRHTL
jgi:hypothetical protein